MIEPLSHDRRIAKRRDSNLSAITCAIQRINDPNAFYIGTIKDFSADGLLISIPKVSREMLQQLVAGESMLVWYPDPRGSKLLVVRVRIRRLKAMRNQIDIGGVLETCDPEQNAHLARLAGEQIVRCKAGKGLPGYGHA